MNGVPLNPFANLETYTTMKMTCSRIMIIVVTSSDCSGILSPLIFVFQVCAQHLQIRKERGRE